VKRWPTGDDPDFIVAFPPNHDSDRKVIKFLKIP